MSDDADSGDQHREQAPSAELARVSIQSAQALLDAIGDVMLLVEPDGTTLLANEAASRRFGVPKAELIGANAFDWFPPGVAQSRRQWGQEAQQTGKPVRFEDERDGRVLVNTIYPIFESSGQVAYGAVLSQDFTGRRRAEDELRQSEQNFKDLAENSPDGILIASLDGAIVYANGRAAEITGYSVAELERMNGFEALTRPQDVPTYKRIMQLRMSGEHHQSSYERTIVTKDGTEVPTEFSTTTTTWKGAPAPLVVVHDITERKRAEEARRRLEVQVQRTQKLESLGLLAGGIAHDFNNILTGLLVNAELALRELPDHSDLQPILRDVQQAGRRAADLTSQMLAYSGRGTFVVEDVDLNALIRDMAGLLRSSTSKKHQLSYELATELPAVTADATQLRQIILNLVTNASEALGEHSGQVTVRTHTSRWSHGCQRDAGVGVELAEGRYVTVEVTDTGCGMDEATRAKVFDPFFSTKFTGRGLGLAAVQGIVRGHRGAILVESEPGEGTTFKVWLPALDGPAERRAAPTAPRAGWRGTGTILVVDDEEIVRSVAARVLEHAGFSVLTAADGAEALEIFRERRDEIACVLLDLKMPRMDGEETFEVLRKISDVPVILSSGYSEQESTERFGDSGLAGFLQKPYQAADLEEKLRQILDG